VHASALLSTGTGAGVAESFAPPGAREEIAALRNSCKKFLTSLYIQSYISQKLQRYLTSS